MSYTQFTLSERKYLQQLLSKDKNYREIAASLEQSPSTISREVKRNSCYNTIQPDRIIPKGLKKLKTELASMIGKEIQSKVLSAKVW